MTSDAAFEHRIYTARDGLQLHVRDYGTDIAGGLPVVCLPGLTRNARDFDPLARHLSSAHERARRVLVFDYRGRGRSAYDPNWKNYNVAVEAQDVIDGLDAFGVPRAAFIGTSRGGLIIHVIAAMALPLIAAVIFNDVGPELGAEGLAHIKHYLANRTPIDSIEDAITGQRAVHGPAFPALNDADFERMTRAIVTESQPWRPDHDPNLLKTLDLIDLGKPLPDLWLQFELMKALPMMVVRGANSLLLRQETVTEMERRHPGLRSVTVIGQGHPPLLETGDLPKQITEFLDSVG